LQNTENEDITIVNAARSQSEMQTTLRYCNLIIPTNTSS